jgi:multidrug efflux pump subunit AcrA (membrane-fusion protein)
MAAEPFFSDGACAADATIDLDQLIDELAAMSKSDIAAEQFHAALIARAVQGLAAIGGATWRLDGRSQPVCVQQLNCPALWPDGRLRHERLIQRVFHTARPAIVPPGGILAGDHQAANSTDQLLILFPVPLEGDGGYVIEVAQRPDAPGTAREGYLGFLAVIAETLDGFHTRRQIRSFGERQQAWRRMAEFAEHVHRSLDVAETAYVLANEGRELIGCDRVHVLLRPCGRFTLAAVSGLDAIDRRADQARSLEKLATVVDVVGEPLWFDGNTDNLPPEVDAGVQSHLDRSHARMLAVVPLHPLSGRQASDAAEPATGVLIAERFTAGQMDEAFKNRVSEVCRHGALALRNAVRHESVPLRFVWLAMDRIGWLVRLRQLPKTAAALVACAMLLFGLCVIPAQFNLAGRGELAPRLRANVFADNDGIVREIHRSHGDPVVAGDVLAVLDDPQLDLEQARVRGELQTAQTRLATVIASRMGVTPTDPEALAGYNRLTAEEEELKMLVDGLMRQDAVLRGRREKLVVRSPIEGQVLTWDVNQLLQSRPVRRGDILFRVANVDGPWELLMKLPDRYAGHLHEARRVSRSPLAVSFVVATEPEVTYTGRVRHVALTTEIDRADDATVLVRVGFDRDDVPLLRPGATVHAKIHCGRKSIGYVWFHDAWDQIHARLLF